MNALVGIRTNSAGNLSATRVVRQEAARQVQANAQATRQSLMLKALGLKAGSSSGRVVDNELGREAFLRLLVNQMQNQDPLEPVENGEMIAQLAQFSALEQMTNLNESFQTLSGNIDQLNFINGSSMLGRRVTGLDVDGKPVDGAVTRVQMDGSVVYLTVGEQRVSMAGVFTIG